MQVFLFYTDLLTKFIHCNYSPPLVIASVAKQSHHAATSLYNTDLLTSSLKQFASLLF